MARELRRTRFVCVSDTHNASPDDGAFKLPKGDVLVHAGDLTKQGTFAELKKTLDWIEKADFEVKLIVAGNHDITLDEKFYSENAAHFHNQHPQDSQACVQLFRDYKSILLLNHESASIRLSKQNGPQTYFRVFGSPFSPSHGLWAFGYGSEQASGLWDQIPLDCDVVITHTPPKNHCDQTRTGGNVGCESLRQALWRVRPSLDICGHVHEGRGAQRVVWDLSSPNVKFKELATHCWEDPDRNTKKQSLVDLSRRGSEPLQNTGPVTYPAEDVRKEVSESWCGAKDKTEVENDQGDRAIRGQNGAPTFPYHDREAPDERLGRKETCIVNAAIMASSWPYKASVGRKYNKPIVVDIDLPVWEGNNHESSEVAGDLDT